MKSETHCKKVCSLLYACPLDRTNRNCPINKYRSEKEPCMQMVSRWNVSMHEEILKKHTKCFSHRIQNMSKTGLSKRQQLIARLLFEMDNRSEIAEQLGISIYTVHNHVKRIYKKMDVSNKKDLLVKLEINGYITTEQHSEDN